MCIDVERYPRTAIRRPATASQFVQPIETTNGHSSAQSWETVLPDADTEDAGSSVHPNSLTAVRTSRTYQVDDEDNLGMKREVPREELARGFEYGRTAVHISESDEGVTKLETEAALEIVGFIPWDMYDRYLSMSSTNIIIAQRTNNKAILALSSFIHALLELESYAIARLVPKSGKPPVLLLLAPSIEIDYECLLDVQIPFAEDVRSYKFPPLDRVVTVSGKILKEHRNLPSDELCSAMDKYMDTLDLSTYGKDDEGRPAEYMAMADTFSPVLHRIDQAVRWRAVHPTEPVPPPYDILTKYSKIPEDLQVASQPPLAKLMKVADVKKGKLPLLYLTILLYVLDNDSLTMCKQCHPNFGVEDVTAKKLFHYPASTSLPSSPPHALRPRYPPIIQSPSSAKCWIQLKIRTEYKTLLPNWLPSSRNT